MKRNLMVVLIFGISFFACNSERKVKDNQQFRAEILQTEKDFMNMAKEEGLAKAFFAFAAEDAVIRRDSLYKGKNAIRIYYERQTAKDVKLEWTPDFVDVSISGDLGYTYGSFVYSAIDAAGKPAQAKGIFHTVWKKQTDGKWRFVWD
jgi:ketosteroid isomerase-like protein